MENDTRAGFSFIEALIILAVITFIEAAIIITVDPWHRFQEARNLQRIANVNFITDAIFMNMIDNDGVFRCAAGDLPGSPTTMASVVGYDIAPCLVPRYATTFPYDPGAPESYYESKRDYNSGYQVMQNPVTGKVLVTAPAAELGQNVTVER
jgi:hypothetical protein